MPFQFFGKLYGFYLLTWIWPIILRVVILNQFCIVGTNSYLGKRFLKICWTQFANILFRNFALLFKATWPTVCVWKHRQFSMLSF